MSGFTISPVGDPYILILFYRALINNCSYKMKHTIAAPGNENFLD